MRLPAYLRAALLSICVLAAAPAIAAGQDVDLDAVRAAKRVAAVRVSEPIVVDGVLDEPAWQTAQPAADFYQQAPDEFSPSTERTDVRFLYDDDMLYVGAVMYDPEPERLVTNELRRDFGGFQNDVLTLIFDTFLDKRNAYAFMVNPGGAQRDVQVAENGRRTDANWDGAWIVRTRIRDDGWSLEFALPFKTLRFPDRDNQDWGLNLMRIVRKKYEFSTWSPVPRQFSHYAIGYGGVLSGIGGVRRGHDLRITPFTTAQLNRTGPATRGWVGKGDGGVDVKWGVTSSLLLDASLRTDFSQVEADEQQINLTRFSLFFPEKRQFFLENSSSFQVGLGATEEERNDFVPFFSRRIGLSSAGQPVPVLGGLRLTGRAGRQGIGLLTVQTGDSDEGPGANVTVARISHELTPSASVGAVYLGRETSGLDSFNRVGGIDLRLEPTRTIEIEAFALRSESLGQDDDWAGRTSVRLDTNANRVRAGLVHVGDAFRNDLGFVRRRGVGTIFGSYERIVRPSNTGGFIREHSVRADVDSASDDRYEQSLTRVAGLNYAVAFSDSGHLTARVSSTSDRLDAPFTVAPGLTIQPGAYHYDTWRVAYSADPSGRLSGNASVEAGEFWTGHQKTAGGGFRFRFDEHIAASASLSRNLIDLPDGSFGANLARLRLDWSFTPRMFLNAFVQYNGQGDSWLSNIRFNLIHRPLSNIYVVWNETRLPTETRRALMLKYTHLFAF